MIDQPWDQSDDPVDFVNGDATPAVGLPQVDARLPKTGAANSVIWQYKGQRSVALAVGASVVDRGVADPGLAVRVDLGQADQEAILDYVSS